MGGFTNVGSAYSATSTASSVELSLPRQDMMIAVSFTRIPSWHWFPTKWEKSFICWHWHSKHSSSSSITANICFGLRNLYLTINHHNCLKQLVNHLDWNAPVTRESKKKKKHFSSCLHTPYTEQFLSTNTTSMFCYLVWIYTRISIPADMCFQSLVVRLTFVKILVNLTSTDRHTSSILQ